MTIRKTLLLAFLLASLLPSILLTYLAFHIASNAMRAQIEQSLRAQATTVSQDIDKILFERLQNAQTWRFLDVMQDIRIEDIDKRLSNFLAEVTSSYGDVYLELYCTNQSGKIIASSQPAQIGQMHSQSKATPYNINAVIHLDPLQIIDADKPATLPIVASIPSAFDKNTIGELHLMFNWSLIYHVLDQAAQKEQSLALIDKKGRIIAASAALRRQGAMLQTIPAEWMTGHKTGAGTHNGAPLHLGDIMVGFCHSPGFEQFSTLGWTVLVIQNSNQALMPIQQMAQLFLLILMLTSMLAIAFSWFIAGRISHPITALTMLTKNFSEKKILTWGPIQNSSIVEVNELSDIFVNTLHELEQSRNDLVRASKLAVLGELAAVMAHEIRTPIGILRSSAQMLAREPLLSAEARELTEFIKSETERLNRLVTTLLNSARHQKPEFKPVDIHILIHQCAQLLAMQAEVKNIRIEFNLACKHDLLMLDAEQMTQVLLNLMLNAIQILPKNGLITISTHDAVDRLILEISDNGPGMHPDDFSRIFDPFFTRREGGVGLGLSVAQQIISAHGGEIRAGASKLGGALFTIILPRKDIR